MRRVQDPGGKAGLCDQRAHGRHRGSAGAYWMKYTSPGDEAQTARTWDVRVLTHCGAVLFAARYSGFLVGESNQLCTEGLEIGNLW